MKTHIKASLVAAVCTLSACTLVSKLQAKLDTSTPGSAGGEDASPSASLAGAAAPAGAFCGTKHYPKYTAQQLHAWFDDPKQGRYELHFLIKVHQALCSPDTAAADRSEIAGMRSTVLRELGLTEADTNDMPKLLDLDMTDTAPDYFELGLPPSSVHGAARASSTSPIDQLYVLDDASHWIYKTRWIADAWGDSMTESARASYVHHCLDGLGSAEPTEQALGYAWCSDDAHHIDRTKLARELVSLPADVRFVAKLELGRLALRIAALEKQIAKDPKLAAVAIETPRKIADDWRAFVKNHRATVDNVRAVELAWMDNGGKAPADCRAKLAADWKKAIASVKVVSTDAPSKGVASASRLGYLSSVGMVRCTARLPGYTGLSHVVGESLDRLPLARGPRTAAFEAAMAELARAHDGDLHVPRMEAVDVAFLPMQQSSPTSGRYWAHTVSSVESAGDKLRIHFKKEKVDHAVCTREEPTGNWIIHDNKIERETHCVSLGAESVMEAVEPVELPAELSSWVRPGNAIVIGADDFPIEIWSDVRQTKLLGLYGTKRG